MHKKVKKHITQALFSQLTTGLILGSSLVFTTGCGKFSGGYAVSDQKKSINPKSLGYFSSLSILGCINFIKPLEGRLGLHEFFRNINPYKERLRALYDLVPLYITENSYIAFLDHLWIS
ncbi:hypothetical protein [Cardinium endosymbiont of Sogatella furcifera]|uniref:hypothetical protein n=1 Tax=Cardinium endosymbiont of Sogatella furcifera TaxID=650378 RepID=UPI000E0D9D2F|nr:hypothetical protein [Cardinium endosymbiont of Sogatella furcifera]